MSPIFASDHESDSDDDSHFWFGDHSFTWVTLKELLAYPWDTGVTTRYGVVNFDEYKVFKEKGKP